jgi:transcriptional regulator GlxA family with amidase domain
MNEETLPEVIKEAIADRYESWELAELLDLSVRDIMYYFETEILEKLEDIKEELRIEPEEDDREYEPF